MGLPSKKAKNACLLRPNKVRWCPAMAKAIQPSGNRKGLVHLMLVRLSVPDYHGHMVVYKIRPSDAGIILNFCPWCGQDLTKGREEKAAR